MPILIGIILILLALFGAPLFIVIVAAALWNFHNDEFLEPLSVVDNFYSIAETPILSFTW